MSAAPEPRLEARLRGGSWRGNPSRVVSTLEFPTHGFACIFPTCPRENARKFFGRPKKFLDTASRPCPGTVPRVGSQVAVLGIRSNLYRKFRQQFPTPVIGKMLLKFSGVGKSSWQHLPGTQPTGATWRQGGQVQDCCIWTLCAAAAAGPDPWGRPCEAQASACRRMLFGAVE